MKYDEDGLRVFENIGELDLDLSEQEDEILKSRRSGHFASDLEEAAYRLARIVKRYGIDVLEDPVTVINLMRQGDPYEEE